jgi:hypothetical protein
MDLLTTGRGLKDNNSTCGIIDKDYYSIITIAETSLALLIYTIVLARTIYTVGKGLGKQGYITILVFYLCEVVSLIVYIVYYFIQDTTQKTARAGPVPDVIIQNAFNSILFYYIYQLKIVQIKIES